jgi:hypothetical protein
MLVKLIAQLITPITMLRLRKVKCLAQGHTVNRKTMVLEFGYIWLQVQNSFTQHTTQWRETNLDNYATLPSPGFASVWSK